MDSDVSEGISQATVKFVDDNITYNCPLANIKHRCGLREGDKRKVKWRDSKYYCARITKIRDDGKVEVQFIEDGVKYTASICDVEQHERVQVGDIRPVKWTDGRYYDAKILKLQYLNELKSKREKLGLRIERPHEIQITSHSEQAQQGLRNKRPQEVQISSHHEDAQQGLHIELPREVEISSHIEEAQQGLHIERPHQVPFTSHSEESQQRLHIERPHELQITSHNKDAQQGLHIERPHQVPFTSHSEKAQRRLHIERPHQLQRTSHNEDAQQGLHIERPHQVPFTSHSEEPQQRLHIERPHGLQITSHNKDAQQGSHIERPHQVPFTSHSEEPQQRLHIERPHQLQRTSHNEDAQQGLHIERPHQVPFTSHSEEPQQRLHIERPHGLQITSHNKDAQQGSHIERPHQVPFTSHSEEPQQRLHIERPHELHITSHNKDAQQGLHIERPHELQITFDSEEAQQGLHIERPHHVQITSHNDEGQQEIHINVVDDRTYTTLKNAPASEFALQEDDYDKNDPDFDLSTDSEDVEPGRINTQSSKAKGEKKVKNKNYCFFCELLVNDFARHTLRNHSHEPEVQEILSTKIGKQRNELFANLRKKGNFINAAVGNIKPVRKLQSTTTLSKVKSCPFCFGYYARKQLWRHKKSCSKSKSASAEQTEEARRLLLTAGHSKNLDLITKVFSRMHDNVSNNVAKKDELICAFGSKFLKTHKQKHQATTCSRKMRELALVLIEIQKIDPTIKNLTQALKPENFDNLVEAAKRAAGYDPATNKYRDSAFAMNVCTSLKGCCEIAIMDANKKKHSLRGDVFARIEDELKTSILLLTSNWRTEVSYDAANTLHMNRMNKVSMVPLASDLKLFKDYLVEEGIKAVETLKCDTNSVKSFQRLVEIVYCRLILLCRKRPGELQRMTLDIYLKSRTMDRSCYEEFQQTLTPTESVLVKRLHRVVIQGKRKETPVIFAPDVKEYTDLLVDLRSQFVSDNNEFLFPRVSTENSIVGYKVLEKFAKLAKCQKPELIKSRGLRKHLATICQLFQMNDSEIEQLSTFMGHTMTTHRNNYRLPDDIYQTAKIAKLLMMMERGEGAAFKGMCLDDINIPLEEDFNQDDTEGLETENIGLPGDIPLNDIVGSNSPLVCSKKVPKVVPKIREVHKWTHEQKEIVKDFFSQHINEKRPPKRNEIEQLYDMYIDAGLPEDWKKIKVFIQNAYSKPSKTQEK